MQIPILIERVGENGYRARSGEPFAVSVEGASRDEALQKARERLSGMLHSGNELASIEMPNGDNPWLQIAGMWEANDPEIAAWRKEMAAYRKAINEDPDAL